MIIPGRFVVAFAGFAGLFAAGQALSAQVTAFPPPRFHGGINGVIAQPTGEFDEYVNVGFGIGGNVRINLDPTGIAALRFDLGYVNYGRETREICFSDTGCLIRLDLTTTNNILFAQAGLQIGVPTGPVRPYVNGGVGYSYFFTQSTVEGSTGDQDPFAQTTNFDDGTFTWAGGGGLMIPLSSGRTPVSLDLGVRYHNNSEVDYVTEDGIEFTPGQPAQITAIRSAAHLITYQIGVSIGFGPGR
jgi:opacity protein-like surface antigen